MLWGPPLSTGGGSGHGRSAPPGCAAPAVSQDAKTIGHALSCAAAAGKSNTGRCVGCPLIGNTGVGCMSMAVKVVSRISGWTIVYRRAKSELARPTPPQRSTALRAASTSSRASRRSSAAARSALQHGNPDANHVTIACTQVDFTMRPATVCLSNTCH